MYEKIAGESDCFVRDMVVSIWIVQVNDEEELLVRSEVDTYGRNMGTVDMTAEYAK